MEPFSDVQGLLLGTRKSGENYKVIQNQTINRQE